MSESMKILVRAPEPEEDPEVAEAQETLDRMTTRFGFGWPSPRVEHIRYVTHEPGFTVCSIDISTANSSGFSEGLGATKRFFSMDKENRDAAQAHARVRAIRSALDVYLNWFNAPSSAEPDAISEILL